MQQGRQRDERNERRGDPEPHEYRFAPAPPPQPRLRVDR